MINRYNEVELQSNYNKFIEALKKSLSGERLEKLLQMYSMEELGPNLMLSPASGNINYHNAYEGEIGRASCRERVLPTV